MKLRDDCERGFSIVEVIIAMFILGVIAMAMLPVLWQGIRFSSEQSAVATATRHLNALVETARDAPNCLDLTNLAAAPPDIDDGKGAQLTVVAELHKTTDGLEFSAADCADSAAAPHRETIELLLQLSAADGTPLAQTTALIYVP